MQNKQPVSVLVVICTAGLEVLLLERADHPGYWQSVTGSRDGEETLVETATREVREETGLELDDLSLFGVYSGPELFYVYPNGDQIYNVIIVYLARQTRGEIRLNDEHTEWRWFAAPDIPADLSPPIRPIIDAFKVSLLPS